MWVLARPKQWKSQSVMTCYELDETERDIPLMDLLDRWELPHKIQDSRHISEICGFEIADWAQEFAD